MPSDTEIIYQLNQYRRVVHRQASQVDTLLEMCRAYERTIEGVMAYARSIDSPMLMVRVINLLKQEKGVSDEI